MTFIPFTELNVECPEFQIGENDLPGKWNVIHAFVSYIE